MKPAPKLVKPQDDLYELKFDSAEQKEKIYKLIKSGLWVAQAEFHAAVNTPGATGTPENMLHDESMKANRRADMWWTQAGLICRQRDMWFAAPVPTVRYVHFK